MLLLLRSRRGKTFQHWGCKMAYYPDVNPGEPFKPVANLENELRHMVNARDGFRGSASAVNTFKTLSVPVWNWDSEVLQSGNPVSFQAKTSKSYTDFPIPVSKYFEGSNWGVLTQPLEPGAIGSCIVTGVIPVNYLGEDYPEKVSPSPNGDGFFSGSDIVCLSRYDDKAIIVLGAGQSSAGYNNYFKVEPLERNDNRITKIVVKDGIDKEWGDGIRPAGYTDLGAVGRKELDIPSDVTSCGVYIKMQSYGSYYGGTIELFTKDYPSEIEPYVLLAEIYDNCSKIAQRWLGGKIYWRDRFFYPFDRDGN